MTEEKDYPSALEFSNPVFTTGLNVTVRLGDKWHGTSGTVDVLKSGDEPEIDRWVGQA